MDVKTLYPPQCGHYNCKKTDCFTQRIYSCKGLFENSKVCQRILTRKAFYEANQFFDPELHFEKSVKFKSGQYKSEYCPCCFH